MNETAKDFLARCFARARPLLSCFARRVRRRLSSVSSRWSKRSRPRYLGWLARENHHGANVYVSANPLRTGSRKRGPKSLSLPFGMCTSTSTTTAKPASLRCGIRMLVPSASAILSTSPGKYQVFWRVEGFDFEQQELILKRLAIAFGGDPACTDQ